MALNIVWLYPAEPDIGYHILSFIFYLFSHVTTTIQGHHLEGFYTNESIPELIFKPATHFIDRFTEILLESLSEEATELLHVLISEKYFCYIFSQYIYVFFYSSDF